MGNIPLSTVPCEKGSWGCSSILPKKKLEDDLGRIKKKKKTKKTQKTKNKGKKILCLKRIKSLFEGFI